MSNSTKRVLYWAPRILGLAFAAFITLFAADAFEGVQGFWNRALALLMHLVPTFVLLGILAVTWRWEWVGAILFTALAVLYLAWAWGRFHWSVYAIICGPLLVTSGLFLVNWIYRGQLRARQA